MATIYNAHPITGEYLAGKETEAELNPAYRPETHTLEDKYLYNRLTCSLVKPPQTGTNETARLKNGQWEKIADHRQREFWHTATKKKHVIQELGEAPAADWTDREPAIYQVWDGTAWKDDLALWLDKIIRPERERRLDACDKYMLEDYPIEKADQDKWKAYRKALRDFPSTLDNITNDVNWPKKPF